MKNKGFTLVELLAVISVLGIVSIFLIPTMMQAFYNSKSMLNKYDLEGIEDAAKMYVADIDLEVKEYTLPGPAIIEGTNYASGSKISGYDFKKYIIDNNGLNVTMYDLVNGGYYDDDCVYAGTTITDSEGKTITVSEDRNCTMPKTCTIKVKINGEKNKNGYWITKSYEAEIVDGCVKK